MMMEANTEEHLDQVLGIKKDKAGISRGLDIQILGSFYLFEECYNAFLLYFSWR